ncbi:MAG: YebC/PmpR family DNA-binding transcriptional regulator [Betaproteobacteria bacterium TMED41]|nr:MAG: YebC/PmpR family DNA-binding transcriptional regulator [Betaproteobacteria bacterium TMED41]
MAGHSKWANIQHRKNRQDERRGRTFGRLIKEITVASRIGGSDSSSNPRLRLAMDKAREANLPKDKVNDAIKRGTGQLEGVNYEEIRYEGYGPGGVAIIIDCVTDNKTRTVSEVRHAFTKNGGNLGTDGSVSFLFRHCSQFIFEAEHNEETILEIALQAGADDVRVDEVGSIEVLGQPKDFSELKKSLVLHNLNPIFAEVTMRAENEIKLSGSTALQIQKLLDVIEAIDDVQNVYTNFVINQE